VSDDDPRIYERNPDTGEIKSRPRRSMESLVGQRIWEQYRKVRGGYFINWYQSLSPIEEACWKIEFERHQEIQEKRPE
jgi:hypothetical protein